VLKGIYISIDYAEGDGILTFSSSNSPEYPLSNPTRIRLLKMFFMILMITDGLIVGWPATLGKAFQEQGDKLVGERDAAYMLVMLTIMRSSISFSRLENNSLRSFEMNGQSRRNEGNVKPTWTTRHRRV
jgi:hypothetical protein